jgi:hypothetical protein
MILTLSRIADHIPEEQNCFGRTRNIAAAAANIWRWRKHMSINNGLRIFAAVLILLASSLYPAFAGAKRKGYRTHLPRVDAARQYSPSLRRIVGGDYVDSEGWRYRPGYGWDNTCFKNLDYLDSQFACGTGGSKR